MIYTGYIFLLLFTPVFQILRDHGCFYILIVIQYNRFHYACNLMMFVSGKKDQNLSYLYLKFPCYKCQIRRVYDYLMWLMCNRSLCLFCKIKMILFENTKSTKCQIVNPESVFYIFKYLMVACGLEISHSGEFSPDFWTLSQILDFRIVVLI